MATENFIVRVGNLTQNQALTLLGELKVTLREVLQLTHSSRSTDCIRIELEENIAYLERNV